MSDRKLLDAAAKAAGIELAWGACGAWERLPGISGNDRTWNPLTDDGDALRLAVKLEMQVCIGGRRIDAVIVRDEDGGVVRGTESKQGDFYAATRRAIVRAAAALQSPADGAGGER